jgi:hypothetical protein
MTASHYGPANEGRGVRIRHLPVDLAMHRTARRCLCSRRFREAVTECARVRRRVGPRTSIGRAFNPTLNSQRIRGTFATINRKYSDTFRNTRNIDRRSHVFCSANLFSSHFENGILAFRLAFFGVWETCLQRSDLSNVYPCSTFMASRPTIEHAILSISRPFLRAPHVTAGSSMRIAIVTYFRFS